jgi:hypothetical protein
MLRSRCRFTHLSNDHEIAFFIFENEFATEFQEDFVESLKDYERHVDMEYSNHVIQVGRDVNDSPISGLVVDYTKMELSCKWKDLFSLFYGEEKVYLQLREKRVTISEIRECKALCEPEAFDMDDEENILRCLARKARIRREVQLAGLPTMAWHSDCYSGDDSEELDAKYWVVLLRMQRFGARKVVEE